MSSYIEKLLDIATGVALGRLEYRQNYNLGAASHRRDGVLVVTYNGTQKAPVWQHHAEARLCRKLTPTALVAVVRVLADGTWAMARPCGGCQTCMRRTGVERVVYSIAPGEYGSMVL